MSTEEAKKESDVEVDTEPAAATAATETTVAVTAPAPAEKSEDELKEDVDRKAELEWEKAAKEAEEAAEAEKKKKDLEKKQKELEKKQKEAEATNEAGGGGGSADDADAQEEEQLHPHRRKIHKLFFFISVVAMIAAVCMATGQIVGLFFKKLGPVQWVLRGYVIALCFLVLFTELEMTKLARENIILHNWVCRGLLYSFVGVIGLEENDTSVFKDDPPLGAGSAKYFMHAASWIILSVGAVYFFMGLLCIQRQYEFERVEFKEKSAQAILVQRDLREKRRNEIRERRLNKKKGHNNQPHHAEDKA